MIYKILSDSIVVIHSLWILFLFLGGIWGRKYRVVKIFHLAGLGFAFLMQVFDWTCPLTHLEVWLRSKHGPGLAYTGSFIPYYLEKIVYIEISPYVILFFTILLCAINGWLYLRKKN
jgi:hypothetical protein